MHMDGVNGVTQCPIAPGDHFVYNFTVTQYGSSWYHSHYSVQYADGAAGPLTLHGPSSANYEEAISPPLIMTDWGHNAAFDSLKTGDFEDFDILLDGLGDVKRFNQSAVYDTQPSPPYSITFRKPLFGFPNKKYLLRIINTSFASAFIFSIDNHMLQVVSADFVPITPFMTKSIVVCIGQRYDIVVEAKPQIDPLNPSVPLPTDGNYWIRTMLSAALTDTSYPAPEGYDQTGILRYNASSDTKPSTSQWVGIPIDDKEVDYTSLHPVVHWDVGGPSNGAVGTQDFGVGFVGQSDWPLAVWRLGGASDPAFQVDYQNISFLNLDNAGGWTPSWRMIEEEYSDKPGSWVWLVIENQMGFPHPIHLHGHDFAIIEQAYNKAFSPGTISPLTSNPPRRDVVLLPKQPGYVIIGFKADNPGAWLVHCHIAFHIAQGLGMQILEDRINATQIWKTGNSSALDEAQRVCNGWGSWCSEQKALFHNAPPLCEPIDSGV